MSSHSHSKSTPRPSKAQQSSQSSSFSSSSSISSHLAMMELKQKILTSLTKLSDRDTYQIAVSDLETTIQTLPHEAIPMLLNCLFDSSNDPKPSVKKECIRLLTVVTATHTEFTSNHLTRIINQLCKRLKDSDSGVREACRDAIGELSRQYIGSSDGVVGLFVKPLFEAMGEQNKAVQLGAASCMAKMVESAKDPPVGAFQKMCPRIVKLLNNSNFLAKAALFPVVTSLAQVGAIAPQSLESLLQSMHECLGSADWATRKAASEALSALALHSSNLITVDGTASTLTALENCRFDKIKPVRDGVMEALQLWKKLAGKGDGGPEDEKCDSHESENSEQHEMHSKEDVKNIKSSEKGEPPEKFGDGSSPTGDSASKAKVGSIPDKASVILKKKVPALTDKELNPEFFQKLEMRGSGDLPVEVVVPRKYLNGANSNNEEELGMNGTDRRKSLNRMARNQSDKFNENSRYSDISRGTTHERWPNNGKDPKLRALDDGKIEGSQQEVCTDRLTEGSFMSNRGSLMAIQRQLLLLERQQAHLMGMVQDFMGGSHESMITLENRVQDLERIVKDMARDLSISSSRRANTFSMGIEGAPGRPLSRYNGFSDNSGARFGRGVDGRVALGERFVQPEGTASSLRGRNPAWRSHVSEGWEYSARGGSRDGQTGLRRGLKSEDEGENAGGRRAWDKGSAPVRHGEGPSARSVWQASKDEATLEAIRVAGEEGGNLRVARVAVPEALEDDNVGHDRDPVWSSWTRAMDAFQVGDVDSAYAEVLSIGDDFLLVKLMDRSGPAIDQLSIEVASEVLHAITQFLLEQNLLDICLSWIQQLSEMVLENGPNAVDIPMEVKKELLINLHETTSIIDPPEDWEGATPEQLLLQLTAAWDINLQQLVK